MKTLVTQRSHCYSAASALLMNPLPYRSNYSLFATPITSLRINTSLVSSGQTLYQAANWRIILQSSMLQRFTAESSRELSALRKLNNKQRQVCSLSKLYSNLALTKNDSRRITLTQVMSDHIIETISVTPQRPLGSQLIFTLRPTLLLSSIRTFSYC